MVAEDGTDGAVKVSFRSLAVGSGGSWPSTDIIDAVMLLTLREPCVAVRHMTYLAIDEKGTEAAAATAVEMVAGASALPKNIMNVDHAFFAAILNDETGAVLFSGIVNDPAVSG